MIDRGWATRCDAVTREETVSITRTYDVCHVWHLSGAIIASTMMSDDGISNHASFLTSFVNMMMRRWRPEILAAVALSCLGLIYRRDIKSFQ